MRQLRVAILVFGAALLAAGTPLTAQAAPSETGQAHRAARVCGPVPDDHARCHAQVRTRPDGVTPNATSGPTGYAPADLQGAYGVASLLPAVPGSGPTVAIVDAFDNPNAEADLAAYRSQFGLGSCTSATGCFTKATPQGTPPTNVGWGQEIDLDIEMVAALCPGCKILLVEARSNSLADLGAAVDYAASQPGVVAISNSYGTSREFRGETASAYNGHYVHSGIAVTASSGDAGYGTSFPAASGDVVSVGGTSLQVDRASHTYLSETAWSGAGSGCSAYFAKPSWQHDSGCSRRTMADVSAVADPATGVSVYDSFGSTSPNNWYVFGGTSVSSPIVASFFALKRAAAAGYGDADHPAHDLYVATSGLRDVVGGTNGGCKAKYLCNAVTGFDGPTGLGTPNGTAAF